jgi:hypothetical protein
VREDGVVHVLEEEGGVVEGVEGDAIWSACGVSIRYGLRD